VTTIREGLTYSNANGHWLRIDFIEKGWVHFVSGTRASETGDRGKMKLKTFRQALRRHGLRLGMPRPT
jgi:hypothetical protein